MNSHEQKNLGWYKFTRAGESGRAELLALSNDFNMCPAHDAMLNGKWKSHANGIHTGSHFTYERKFTRDLDSHEQLIHMSFNLGELDQNQGCFLYAKCRLGVKCEWNSHGKPLRVWVEVHTRLGFTRAVDSQELQFGQAGTWFSWFIYLANGQTRFGQNPVGKCRRVDVCKVYIDCVTSLPLTVT